MKDKIFLWLFKYFYGNSKKYNLIIGEFAIGRTKDGVLHRIGFHDSGTFIIH